MPQRETATLAGGCFWCLEAAFQDLKGVDNVQSGYAGGRVANPSYEDVRTGTTGHAEVVQITFDPQIVTFEDLLHVFFTIHDPTTLNRQGADVGTQYRSAIFYHTPEQKATAERVIAERVPVRLDPMTPFERKVVHDAVAEIKGVVSESEGEEPRRQVIVSRSA